MDNDFELNPSTYDWTVRSFSQLKKLLGINIKLHGDTALLDQGEIFLFNHFARTETFLPHYVIHQETGAYCRCIATKAIFSGSKTFKRYLGQVGVVPNNHKELLPMLVAEIIRGRKVIVYPEGGMVKDRRVLDDKGRFSIYSRKSMAYRKHHSGAAVMAIALDTFKLAVQLAEARKDWQRIDAWVDMIGLNNREHLLFAAYRPTLVIPGNITFYPIHTEENFLHKTVDVFTGELDPALSEEIIIESNLLLKDTDMDLRLGNPVCVSD
ncbi:MAG: acyltransferase, partial [Thiotrichales bacterium]|nr:acyltransferase [Thiotrichales bacterium]